MGPSIISRYMEEDGAEKEAIAAWENRESEGEA